MYRQSNGNWFFETSYNGAQEEYDNIQYQQCKKKITYNYVSHHVLFPCVLGALLREGILRLVDRV